MKKPKLLFLASIAIFGLAVFVLLDNRKATADAPLCSDIQVKVNENTTCKVEVKNTTTSNLKSLGAEITIPNGARIISYDSAWNCTKTGNVLSCNKAQSPELAPNQSDFLEMTFTQDQPGTFNFTVDLSGVTEVAQVTQTPVQYTNNTAVSYSENNPPPTADAVDDDFGVILIDPDVPPVTPFFGNVAANDTLCSAGSTTTFSNPYNIINLNNVSPISNDPVFFGDVSFEYVSPGQASFDYDLLCDGVVMDSAHAVVLFVME